MAKRTGIIQRQESSSKHYEAPKCIVEKARCLRQVPRSPLEVSAPFEVRLNLHFFDLSAKALPKLLATFSAKLEEALRANRLLVTLSAHNTTPPSLRMRRMPA